MLIKEIELSHTGGINLEKISRVNEVPFGFNNEIDNFKFFTNEQDGYKTYYLISDETVIAALAGIIVLLNGIEYFQIKGVYVSEKYRGNNIALKMYHAIKHISNYRLMSDSRQTRDGIKLWANITKHYPYKVIDITSGKIVSDKKHDAYTNKNYVIVTEAVEKAGIIIPPL
jgi:hypothetical protein